MAESGLEYVKEVGKYIVTAVLWPPLKRHVDYLWCFHDNIQGLGDAIRGSKRARLAMVQKTEEARYRAETALVEAENWSNEAIQQENAGERILQRYDELKPWDIIPRYLVGKSAKRTAEGILKLQNEGNTIAISYPAPPRSVGSLSQEASTMKFESRRRIEEDILESLKDSHVPIIAICGAGGVGKTTMVEIIEDRVREERLFDEVVQVVVGQQIDMLKLQKEIAEILGLRLIDETLAGRAHKICTRLLDKNRKLVIFDNVWKSFKLKDIGVPVGNYCEGCKIILTSRSRDVCEEMEAHKVVQIEVLDEEEAWRLFREKSDVCDDDSIAKDVAAECNGLPIALVTVGIALKSKSKKAWEDSLSQLRRANPTTLPQVLKQVYMLLKLSYDFLETESEKSLFLLCCMFPDNCSIPIELLTLCSIGLDMHEGIRNIEEGRNRTYHLVERLKSRFLLLNGSQEHDVKMHDIVRDVAINIGLKERRGFLKSLEVSSMPSSGQDSSLNCNWLSIDISKENAKLPTWSDFPNLRLLMILNSTNIELPKKFDFNFGVMEELNVLCFSQINIPSFPPNLKLLKTLTKLHLGGCAVKDISILGELASLIILRVHECGNIEELPGDIGRLNHLKLLELIGCRKLVKIVAGVMSSLVGLEELKIIGTFGLWEEKEYKIEESNACLCELESLPNLTSLEIDICDPYLVAEELCLPQRLVRYRIRSKVIPHWIEPERKISLYLPRDVRVGNWILQLAESTQSLILAGDGSHNFNLSETECLRVLMLEDCSTMKKLVNGIDCKFHLLQDLQLKNLKELKDIIDGTIPEGSNAFKNLEHLSVVDLPKLAHLWKSPNQNISLGNVYHINIYCCPNLRYLFSVATARSLVHLGSLYIESCDKIEQVFWNDIENNTGDSMIEFPELMELKLRHLPNLTAISQGIKITEFPNLEELTLRDLPNFTSFSQGFEIIEFPLLEHLDIINCPKLGTETWKWNIQLKSLGISQFKLLDEIFWYENEDEGNRRIIFPELEGLELSGVPCLTTYYRNFESIEFPQLDWLKIKNFVAMDSEPTNDDHSLHFFCNQTVQIPSLKTLWLVDMRDAISKIWCRHIPINILSNLMFLGISNVDGIKSFMPPSIAKNLVNLEELSIKRCQEVVEVIEDEDEVFVTSLFPKLECLKISMLYKLRSFCQWHHAFELPSLKEVEIDDCPGMETFALGLLSTPNLYKFKINKKLVERKGLNDGIHDHFMTKSQEGDKDLEFSYENSESSYSQNQEGDKDMEFSSEDSENSYSQSKEGAEDLEFSSDDPEYSSMDSET